jgi:hypothetical protein
MAQKNVKISDVFSNQEIKTFQVDLGDLDPHLLDQDYIEEAWKMAVEAGIVDQAHREKYKFEIVVD